MTFPSLKDIFFQTMNKFNVLNYAANLDVAVPLNDKYCNSRLDF